MVFVYFLLEIIVGYMLNATSLVADSFHMLSDLLALLIALYAIRLAKRTKTTKHTYGWARAEVLGALINGVFLLALCVTLVVEIMKRFIDVEEVQNPELVVFVGAGGLVVNIIGLFLFHHHGPGHDHGHGHSHGHHHHHGPTGTTPRASWAPMTVGHTPATPAATPTVIQKMEMEEDLQAPW